MKAAFDTINETRDGCADGAMVSYRPKVGPPRYPHVGSPGMAVSAAGNGSPDPDPWPKSQIISTDAMGIKSEPGEISRQDSSAPTAVPPMPSDGPLRSAPIKHGCDATGKIVQLAALLELRTLNSHPSETCKSLASRNFEISAKVGFRRLDSRSAILIGMV